MYRSESVDCEHPFVSLVQVGTEALDMYELIWGENGSRRKGHCLGLNFTEFPTFTSQMEKQGKRAESNGF